MNDPIEATKSFSESPFSYLPDELWALVLDYLSLREMGRAQGTSKTLYNLVTHLLNSKSSIHQWIYYLTNTKFKSTSDYETVAAFIRGLDTYKATAKTLSNGEFEKIQDNEFLLYFLVQNCFTDLAGQQLEWLCQSKIKSNKDYPKATILLQLMSKNSQAILKVGAPRLNEIANSNAIESFHPKTQNHIKLLSLIINHIALYDRKQKKRKQFYEIKRSLRERQITQNPVLDMANEELEQCEKNYAECKQQISNLVPQENVCSLYLPRTMLREVQLPDGMDLSGSNFFNANLSSIHCRSAKLVGVNLSHANLTYASLDKTDLSRSDLSHVDLSNASLAGTNLSDVNLGGAIFKAVNICNATVNGTKWIDREQVPTLEVQLNNLTPETESDPLIIEKRLDELNEMIGYQQRIKGMSDKNIHQLRESIAIDVKAIIGACKSESSQKQIAIDKLVEHPIFQPRKQANFYKLVNTGISKFAPKSTVFLPSASQAILIRYKEQLMQEEKNPNSARKGF
jgi:uncharacterized protein YjbI with pentapeptide repeats